MQKQETAKMNVTIGVERTFGRRDIPVANAPVPQVTTVETAAGVHFMTETDTLGTLGVTTDWINTIFAERPIRPRVPQPKPMKYRAKVVGGIVEDGIKATLEDLMNDPSKYEGKAFQMVDSGYTYVAGWGDVAPVRGQFVIQNISQSRYANGLVEMEGVTLKGGAAHMPIAAKSAVVEEVQYDKEDLRRGQMALMVRQANTFDHIGSDPEVFAVDGEGNLVPAFEFLKSADEVTKPKMDDRVGTGEPFWDGYQAEFNTTPDACLAYHTDSVREGLVMTLEALKKKYPDGKLSVKTTFDIPPERLLNDDRKYVNFGCTPSKSVYGETFPDVDPATIPFRSAGGHLHFTMDKKNAKQAVKELDRILGVMCVGLFQYYDDARRRLLYGRAGEYRLPKYGIEYRTLSNAWMIHPATAHFVYEIGRRCIGFANAGGWDYWKTDEDEVRKCINECDVELAKKIMTDNMDGLRLLLESLPTTDYAGTDGFVDKWIEVMFNGIHTVLSKPDEYSRTWVLEPNADAGLYWIGHSEGECGNFSRAMHYMMQNDKGMID